MAVAPLSYEVVANNLSREAENKIHDDAVARRFGFTGGLVPGVEVYAYACHLILRRFGPEWLDRGVAECRFLKPVYDGRRARVTAEPDGDALAWRVESEGELCATGSAAMGEGRATPRAVADYPVVPPAAHRPPAGAETIPPGAWFGSKPLTVTPELAAEYLAGIAEADPLYAADAIVHPGQILRLCNYVLAQNVVLGPWIHVGSSIRNLGRARVGDTLTARARVDANYERKGHLFVDLDVLVVAGADRPVAQVAHTAIYRPRQVTEAA
jgi:acyl dehydratase